MVQTLGSTMRIFALLSVTFLGAIACQKNSNQGGGPVLKITAEQVVGAWEQLAAFSPSMGKTFTSKPSGSTDPDSHPGKIQYLITDTTFTLISSDDLVATQMSTPYTIQGAELVTPEKNGNKVYAFTVLEITADTMTVKPAGGSEPADLIYQLKRIKSEELLTKTLKVVEQSVSFKLQSELGSIDTKFSDPLNSAEKTADSVSCYSYKSEINRQFAFNARRLERTPDGGISWSSATPSISLQMASPFDFSKASEVISVTVEQEINGTGDDKLRLLFGSKCALKLQREGRILSLALECPNLMVSSSSSGKKVNASLKVTGQCGLVF